MNKTQSTIIKEELPNVSEDVMRVNPEIFSQPAVVNIQPTKRGNKYHVSSSVDRTYNGITYDSRKEMQTAINLDLKVKAREIDFWLRQVPFIIGNDPLTVYRADFMTFFVPFNTPGLGHYCVTVIEVKPKSEKAWAPGAKRKLNLFRKKFPNLKLEVV